jgi:hypothetical protein
MAAVFTTFMRYPRRLLTHLRKPVEILFLSLKPPKQVFTDIYRLNKWGGDVSRSGQGSSLTQTEAIRSALPALLQELHCKSVLDVPCGDFFWMSLVEMDVDYIGGDIVDELIELDQEKYGSNVRRFMHLDVLEGVLPQVDLIFCRDLLVHLSYGHIRRALKNIKDSGSTYLLTTTFVGRDKNKDIPTGKWRPINLLLPPFSFPAPLRLIDEKCPNEIYRDKHLGLWKTADIPDL